MVLTETPRRFVNTHPYVMSCLDVICAVRTRFFPRTINIRSWRRTMSCTKRREYSPPPSPLSSLPPNNPYPPRLLLSFLARRSRLVLARRMPATARATTSTWAPSSPPTCARRSWSTRTPARWRSATSGAWYCPSSSLRTGSRSITSGSSRCVFMILGGRGGLLKGRSWGLVSLTGGIPSSRC